MNHLLVVTVHALAATAALLFGVLALRSARFVALHAAGVVIMGLALGPSIWLSRAGTATALQLVFCGLLALSAVMSYRGVVAYRCRPWSGQPLTRRYLGAVGFNVIGLVTGFVTVGVLRLGWGGVAVGVAAVAIPLVGHRVLAAALAAAPSPAASSG